MNCTILIVFITMKDFSKIRLNNYTLTEFKDKTSRNFQIKDELDQLKNFSVIYFVICCIHSLKKKKEKGLHIHKFNDIKKKKALVLYAGYNNKITIMSTIYID